MKTIVNYAQKVKEQHALNKTLAPVETDLTSASKAYAVGQKFIHDGVLYQAKTAIAQGAALVLNTNYEAADDVSTEIEALTNQANDMVNVLGAKNVLPFPYYAGSGTYNGVTITDNGDGSITLDGTCTGMSFFVFYGGRYSLAPTTFVKKNEDYIATLEVVSGSMAINSGASRFVFRNYITNATSPFVDIFYEDNVIDTRSVKFTYEPTASYDTSLVWYEFNVGTTFNNWRIRPMIRLASITDDTYEPYAKTNQQLTAENQTLANELDTTYLLAEQKTHSFAVSGATNAEILQNLAQHMLDFIQGLNDGVVIELLNLTIRGTGTTLIIPQKVLLTNAITDLSFNLFAMAGGSGTTYLYTGTVWASTLNANKLSVCTLQDNQTPVTTNYDFTNATSFNFEMKHWKVVDLS